MSITIEIISFDGPTVEYTRSEVSLYICILVLLSRLFIIKISYLEIFLVKAFKDKRDPINIPHFEELRLWGQESTPQKN